MLFTIPSILMYHSTVHTPHFVAVPQGRTFLYYSWVEWTIYQTLAIERCMKNEICKNLVRPEKYIEYWDLGTADAAKQALKETLLSLVYDG
jgi:hypothetical protein